MTTEREEELRKLVKEDWEYFGTLSKKEQTKAVIDTVLLYYPWTFSLIKSKKMKTYSKCHKAVNYNGMLLQYVPKKIQDKLLVRVAVHKDAAAYSWIKNDKLKTFDLSISAVKRWGLLINAVPQKLKRKVKDTIIAQTEKRLGKTLTEKEIKNLIKDYTE